ncbi:MAG: NAD(P)/FAD-dependent oxidoreductase [Deltaproteobacteria bacterium]|nr:NAD(P)/FAD-dependent oxidoreductase [Deltaproteobacteria bacterium]
MTSKKTAVIIGAGPAGLTAAYELVNRTNITPLIIEATDAIGGISKTVNYKGNRMDIGGHRFFSKSKKVMDWWLNILPLEETASDLPGYSTAHLTRRANAAEQDAVMLVRNRLSRIYYLRKFFDYPITLNWNTISNLGIFRMGELGLSYLNATLFPIRNEQSLEDFLVNRFGKRLYRTFFKDYTEKVWGVPCKEIGADWGAQRIKGLSIRKALGHAVSQVLKSQKALATQKVETSLINRFLYPKFGPGQLWENVAAQVVEKGACIQMNERVVGIDVSDGKVISVTTANSEGRETKYQADYVFSTMPVKDLVVAMGTVPPNNVKRVADGLMYRDFVTVGLLLKKMKGDLNGIRDNWIYIQESDVKIGRLQVFNNWSPYMVADSANVWLGLEYFCNEGDELWQMTDDEFAQFAISEMTKIDMIEQDDVIDAKTIRVPKTYPGYFGTYSEFSVVESWMNTIENLYLVGRNGMHRYNNQDHSMLSAITAVDNIIEGRIDKSNIWAVNTEDEYHEEK